MEFLPTEALEGHVHDVEKLDLINTLQIELSVAIQAIGAS
jgi:hypothetical protein